MQEQKDIWNLTDLLQGRTIAELEKEIKKDVAKFASYRKELSPKISAQKILEIIIHKEKISFDLEALQDYYGLDFTTNTNSQDILAKMTYYDQLATDISNELIFFPLWFMNLDEKAAQKIIGAPETKDYRYYLEELRKAKPYTKDEATEKIISIKNITDGAFGQLYDIFTNSFPYHDLVDEKKKISQDELRRYVYDKDPQKREQAYKQLLAPYKEHETVMGEFYKNIVLSWRNEGIRIRGYKTSIGIRDIRNDIDTAAVRTLLSTVKKNNKLFIDYFKLRRAINKKYGQDYNNSRYHIYTPFAGESTKKYSYEETKKLVLDTYKQFDKRFYDAALQIFAAKHVHSHPGPGKRSGAYCSYLGGIVKPYIFLNHNGNIRDVFTMMHEFGHGIHGILAEKQKPLLMHAALPMAETASIMGEMILSDRLLKESKDTNEKISILMQLIDNAWASITRQSYFVLFEEAAHERISTGATLTELDTLYMELLKEQFGDMEIPAIFTREWNYIPHIHHTPFYCYAYAWGNLLVFALYDQYKKEGKAFVEKLVIMLADGGSKRPQDILADLDIDPSQETFWQSGFDIIKEYIAELEKLIKK